MTNKLPANSGRLMRIVRWAFECRHDWDITACNGFGSPIEEQCEKCGMYQHRILKAEKLHEHPEWKLGRHPQSPPNDQREGPPTETSTEANQ
jgi:hypothetical protein